MPDFMKNPAGSDPPAKDPQFKTTAEALMKEFFADEKAALAKYKNKVVEFDGTVLFATKMLGEDRITITGAKKKPGDYVTVNLYCILSSQESMEKAWWFGKHQKVKVVELGLRGQRAWGLPERCCVVTETGPNPTPKVTAEALVEEFIKDPEGAKMKYKEGEYGMKEVIVDGTVEGTETTKDGLNRVILAGKDGGTITFAVDKKVKEGLKKGDKVTMKGTLSGFFDTAKKQLNVSTAFALKCGSDPKCGAPFGKPRKRQRR